LGKYFAFQSSLQVEYMSKRQRGQYWHNIPPYSKVDQLDIKRHKDVIFRVLSDPETQIDEISDNTYVLYGDEQALLVPHTAGLMRVVIRLFRSIFMLKIR
jgi:hypothetical protein